MPERLPPIVGAATSIAAFLGPTLTGAAGTPQLVSSFGEFATAFGGLALSMPLGYAVRSFFANGGREALICPTEVASTGSAAGLSDSYAQGLESLADTEAFNLLCVPPDTRIGWTCESASPILAAAATLAVERRALLIVDPPSDFMPDQPTLPQLGLTASASRNAALYFPYVVEPDPLQALLPVPCAPCGVVAGVIARNDLSRGVWHAAAGTRAALAGVTSLATILTAGDTERFTANGVNCLRTFPSSGPVIWGARTLAGRDAFVDEYQYVPVRRLALFIEESLSRGLAGISTPNAEPLWSDVRAVTNAFLHGLWLQGALRGDRPHHAYSVHCDASTMTADDIERGVLGVRVGFAPVRPAEFVILSIRQLLCPDCSS